MGTLKTNIIRNYGKSVNAKYLTFTAAENNCQIKLYSEGTALPSRLSLEYTTNGYTWRPYTFTDVIENGSVVSYDGETVSLPYAGNFVQFRASANNTTTSHFSNDSEYYEPDGYYRFSITGGNVYGSGNVMSLLYKKMSGNVPDGAFFKLFYYCVKLISAPYLNGMGILGNRCFFRMFAFSKIDSFAFIGTLNMTTKRKILLGMFEYCTLLTDVSDIYWSGNTEQSYFGINSTFRGTSLSKTPSVICVGTASSYDEDSLQCSFYGCTSLVDASGLNHKKERTPIYRSIKECFMNCTSLKYPPYMNYAEFIAGSGGGGQDYLRRFFKNCTSLKEIIMSGNDGNGQCYHQSYTYDWVRNVSPKGTFFCDAGTKRIFSPHAIPLGWNVEEIDDSPLCFTADIAGSKLSLDRVGDIEDLEIQTSTDGSTWTTYEYGTVITLANVGDKVYFRSTSRKPGNVLYKSATDYYRFKRYNNNHRVSISGNLFTLLRLYGTYVPDSDATNVFYSLFNSFKIIQKVLLPKDLDATFNHSFYRTNMNTSITSVVLDYKKAKFTNLCFYECFRECRNLTSATIKIRSNQLSSRCFQRMFSGSSNLSRIEVYFTTWGYMTDWVSGVAATGLFIHPKGLDVTTQDTSHVPVGWTTKTWEEEVCDQYPSVAALVQQYPALGDVVDTYPNLGAVLDQYPNLVHSLVNTGNKPYIANNSQSWGFTGVYPHQYMAMEYVYYKPGVNTKMSVISRASTTQGWFAVDFGVDGWKRLAFGDVAPDNQGTACGDAGKHTVYISKDAIKYDGVNQANDNHGIRRGNFDTFAAGAYLMPNRLSMYGADFTFYSLKIWESDVLTHHYVPLADNKIADIADLDNVKIIEASSSNENIATFGLETI